MSEARLQAFRQRRFLFVCKQAQSLTSSLKASQHLYPGLIFATLDLGLLISLVLDNITFYTLGEDQQYFSKLH